ncbi:MAG: hypothetical protein PHE96_03980 [Methylococcales bacterium]|nr:hypothetical protein [Methylococcales bacterium]
MKILVEACPSFTEEWEGHLRENGNELLYSAAGAFADHLLALYRLNDTLCFGAVGVAIERFYTEGSPWVREFATIGILEGIQNGWSNNEANPEDFVSFLGSESRQQWQSLNDFWNGKVPHVGHKG